MGTIKLPEHFGEQTSRFFFALLEVTEGKAASQVSMYDIGERIGLDRNEAARAAEVLMAEGWVEVRTLAGGIGFTQNGVDAVAALKSQEKSADQAISGLGSGALLEAGAIRSVETVVAELKLQVRTMGLDFEKLAELIADLRTVDAQLASPRPKTAIIRACFKSILGFLVSNGITEKQNSIKQLLA